MLLLFKMKELMTWALSLWVRLCIYMIMFAMYEKDSNQELELKCLH